MFDATRKREPVSAFNFGQHECLGRDVALAFVTGLIKLAADLKQLRPAPGQMGLVKTIRVGTEKAYLNDSWSNLSFDASSKLISCPIGNVSLTFTFTAWKVHFDGHGRGNFEGERTSTKPMVLQQYYHLIQKRKEELLN